MKSRRVVFVLVLAATFAGCSGDDKPTTPQPQPAISVQDKSVVEGNTFLFQISLDRVTDHRVTFAYATIDGTALAGSDYTAVSGNDTIPTGQTSVTILVPTIDDSEVESSESFSLVVSAVAGAQVSRGLATGTITDNEVAIVSFTSQVRPLLQTSCAKSGFCHGSLSTPGGALYLGATVMYASVISATGNNTGGRVVQPGNSASSTLYTKTTAAPPFPSRMPQDGPPYLSLTQQNLIKNWIDQGAQDN
jgi:hypothetical protein